MISKSAVSDCPNQETKPAAPAGFLCHAGLGGSCPCCLLPSKIVLRSILHLPPLVCLTMRHLVTSASALGDLRGLLSHTAQSSGTELLLPGSCQQWVMTRRLNAEEEGMRARGLAPTVWKVFFLGQSCVVSKHALLTEISNKRHEKSNQNALRI